jgi:hypothetical protein
MTTNQPTREPGGWRGGRQATLDPKAEEAMTLPKGPEPGSPARVPEEAASAKLPLRVRNLLAQTAEEDWPRIRAFLVESEEGGELLEMLPELNRVMKNCPARLAGRLGRRELTADEIDRAYRGLHESLHRVRQAIHSLLHLAGYLDVRPPEGPDPESMDGPPGPGDRELPPAAKPPPVPPP